MVTRLDDSRRGPLAPWASQIDAALIRLGYARRTAVMHVQLAGRFSCWLEVQGLSAGDIAPEVVKEFIGVERARGGWFQPTARTLGWLLDLLDDAGVTSRRVKAAPLSPVDALLERYRSYLIGERGLVEGTVAGYLRTAAVFLAEYFDADGGLESLVAADVLGFVTSRCPRYSVGTAKLIVTGLRSLLGFVYLEGLTSAPLAGAVPSAAGWSQSSLPRGLRPGECDRLLGSCDRSQRTGRRDYAILVVLVRLGLRAAEVAGLRLDDVDWRAGEIVVHGKGASEERLPLPVDVGEAIAVYLRDGRPHRDDRSLFLRVHAPLRALSAEGVAEVVRTAGERAGLGSFGPHRLRHTAATEMLRAGSTLAEVAQVLRQHSTATTAIYAKVDHLALRGLAMPWPGDER